MPRLQADRIEGVVWEKVKELIRKPVLIRKAVEKKAASMIMDKQTLDSKTEELDQALKKIDDQNARMFEAYRRGIIAVEQLDMELAKIKTEKEGLENSFQNLRKASETREKLLAAMEGLLERLKGIRLTGREEYLVQDRLMIGLISGIFVTNTGEIRLEGKLDGLKTSPDLTTGSPEPIFAGVPLEPIQMGSRLMVDYRKLLNPN
jgi:chaperonin cofactor prefoldin